MFFIVDDKVDFHWWGKDLLLISNLSECCILSEEETFLIRYLTKTMEYDNVIDLISTDLGCESEMITKFVSLFLENYKAYFRLDVMEKGETIKISGREGMFYPLELHISLTNRCVQKCVHCYKIATNQGIDINVEHLYNILDTLQGYVPYLSLSGGEPTIHPFFSDIIRRYANTYSICILSSGYRISETMLDVISLAKRGLTISIYSYDAEEHNTFAGKKDSYEGIMHTLELAREKNIPIDISTILREENFREIELLIEQLFKMGVRHISVGSILPVGRAKINGLDTKYKKSDLFYEQLTTLKNKYNNLSVVGEWEKRQQLNLSPFRCMAGTLSWSIFENGEIHPCGVHTISELMIGKLDEFDLNILFDRSSYNERIVKFSNIYKKSNAECLFSV